MPRAIVVQLARTITGSIWGIWTEKEEGLKPEPSA